jgi:hypothetical protein
MLKEAARLLFLGVIDGWMRRGIAGEGLFFQLKKQEGLFEAG